MRTRGTHWAAMALVAAVLASDACAPTPAPSTPTPSAPETTAPIATASVAPSAPASAPSAPPASPTEVLANNRAPFVACYERARSATPSLGRTSVEITFAIDGEGTPRTVDLQYRNRLDDRAKDCLRDAALGLRFPSSMEGRRSGTIVFAPPTP